MAKNIYVDGEKVVTYAPKVVNDLTTGGTAKALSAEQGKTLKGLIDNIHAGSIDDLTDTDISNKADGDVLQYDSTSSKWKNKPTTFTEASSRTNIASGDSLSTIFGKIKKFFSDLNAVAFSGAYSDLTGQPTIPAAVAVKGNNEANYRTGNVNLTPANIGSLYSQSSVTINNLNDLVNLLDNSGGQRGFAVTAKINANIGVGVTGWQRILGLSQNGPNNGTYDLGLFCLFVPAGTTESLRYAIINGKTTNNYSVSQTGILVHSNNIGSYATQTSVQQGSEVTVQVVSSGNSYAYTVNANNNKVGQTNSASNNADYRVLYSVTADDANRTEDARKGAMYFNPSTRRLFFANGVGTYGNVSKALVFQDGSDSNHALQYAAYNNDANYWGLWPNKDGWLGLGNAWRRWGQIYSTSASISTSDRNEKKDIVPLDESAKDFVMKLNPVSFKFINGESGRTHYGMIAQDVEEEMAELGMTTMDFAGLIKFPKKKQVFETVNGIGQYKDVPAEGEFSYGLRYDEFIPLLIKTVQMQQEEIDQLNQRIKLMEEQLNG